MSQQDREPTRPDDPLYEARLRAQHGLLLALGQLPAGLATGLFLGAPIALAIEGFPTSIVTTGVISVLLLLGLGLLALGVAQGALRLVGGFWQLRHALHELREEQRIAWFTALAGLFLVGLALGYALVLLLL